MNVFETPRCPATISSPGWQTAQCAWAADHKGRPHGGFRWDEIRDLSRSYTVHPGGAPDANQDD